LGSSENSPTFGISPSSLELLPPSTRRRRAGRPRFQQQSLVRLLPALESAVPVSSFPARKYPCKANDVSQAFPLFYKSCLSSLNNGSEPPFYLPSHLEQLATVYSYGCIAGSGFLFLH
ncbi:hypothetical protein T310_9174, partial [Rasamsonia emersonii CBS 393.64]